MVNVNYNYIVGYLQRFNSKSDSFLKELEKNAKKRHIPILNSEVVSFLEILVKITNTKKILELGTAIGYSSIIFSKSMNDKGSIVTVEKDNFMANEAEQNFKKMNITNIKVINDDADIVLKKLLSDNLKFDFIFLDAAKSKYINFLPLCIDLLDGNGILVADNVLFKGMVANECLVMKRKRTIVNKLREFLNAINNDKSLISSVIPLGDGISVSYKIK